MTYNLYHLIHKSLLKGLKIALIGLFLCPLLTSCGVTKRIVDVERIVTTYKDSVIYHQKDSIVYFPVERIVDVAIPYDTLKMETSLAKATAYVDTNYHIIRGNLLNKPEIAKEWHIQYVDRIVERTDTLVHTETIEVPVEVVKYKRDKLFWGLVSYLILSILSIVVYIKMKFF